MGRVQAGQRLIHQHDLRFDGQGTRQQGTLTFAARQLTQRPLAPIPELGLSQHTFHHLTVLRIGRRQPFLMGQATEHRQVIHREIVGARFVLAQPGQGLGAFPPRPLGEPSPLQQHFALARRQARQSAQQSGFARAIGTHDACPQARGNLQVDLLQNWAMVQGHGQLSRRQGVLGCRAHECLACKGWRIKRNK